MVKHILFAVVCSLVVVTLSAGAEARLPRFDEPPRAVSPFGGETLGAGRSALAVGGGYPSFFFQYSAGLDASTDLGLRADLLWASPYTAGTLGSGVQLAMPMRFQLARGSHAALAVLASPDVVVGRFVPGGDCICSRIDEIGRCVTSCNANDGEEHQSAIGVGVDLGLAAGIPMGPVNLLAGVSSPIHFVAATGSDRTDLYVPVAPYAGAEVRLTRAVNVFGLGQLGYTLHQPRLRGAQGERFARVLGGVEVGL